MSGRQGRIVDTSPARGRVWLGDLALAIDAVAAQDEDTRRRIAVLLGLVPSHPAAPRSRDTLPEPEPEPSGLAGLAGAGPEPAAAVLPGAEPSGGTVPPSTGAGDHGTGVPGGSQGSGTWADDADARAGGAPATDPTGSQRLRPVATLGASHRWTGPRVARPDRDRMTQQPPRTPLFTPLSTAALLESAVADRVPEGEVDMEAAVRILARGTPLAELPRRMRRTLRHGVQVLVDQGPAMQLFSRDQNQLCRQVEALVGNERTQVLRFAYTPLRGTGEGPSWTWRAYSPPPRGSAVLLLTDCGVIGPPGDHARSRQSEWLEFAAVARRHGTRPLALVPLPQHRLPFWLRVAMPVITWDRHTTVGQVSTQMAARPEPRVLGEPTTGRTPG